MRHSILLLFIQLFLYQISLGQKLNKTQMLDFANKLYEVEILSQKGKRLLEDMIQEETLGKANYEASLYFFNPIPKEESKLQLLLFCGAAFEQELMHRSGTFIYHQELVDLQKKRQERNEKDWQQVFLEIQEKVEKSKGYQIETKIKDEDRFPTKTKYFAPKLSSGMAMIVAPLEEVEKYSNTDIPPPPNNTPGWHPMILSSDLIANPSQIQSVIHPNRSAWGKNCSKTALDLLKIGLIDERTYTEVKTSIEQKQLTLECNVLEYALVRAIYNASFEENKQKENENLKKWRNLQIISEENYQELNRLYANKALPDQYDLVPYCQKANVFDLTKYTPDPEIGYPQFMADLRKLLPNFKYQNLHITYEYKAPPKEADLKNWNTYNFYSSRLFIDFQSHGLIYQDSIFYYGSPLQNLIRQGYLEVSYYFIDLLNWWLKEQNSPYRLYRISAGIWKSRTKTDKEIALILLNEQQAEGWLESKYNVENHDNYFRRSNLPNIIQEYKNQGLFIHLSEAEFAEGIDCINTKQMFNHLNILSCFPKTLIYNSPDSSVNQPYSRMSKILSDASGGAFEIIPLKEEVLDTTYTNPNGNLHFFKVKFVFELQGKKYKRMMEGSDRGFLGWRLIFEVNEILEKRGIDAQIYETSYGDYDYWVVIVLNQKQYQFLEKLQPSFFGNESE